MTYPSSSLLRSLRIVRLLGLVIVWPAASLLADKTKDAPSQLVWPPPPDPPRIAYVQSISTPEDAGIKPPLAARLSNWVSGTHQGNEPLGKPFGVALDEAGNLCIADTGAKQICFFDRGAKKWYRWGQIDGINFVSPVAVAKAGGTIYVADSDLGSVTAFGVDGKLLFRITAGLLRPVGLAISNGRLLVADAAGQCVDIFDTRGKLLTRFGSHGADAGQFNYPTHLATDAHGNIYVTDSMNSRVEVFDATGNFERQLGEPGDSPGTFSRPKGVAIDPAGHTYVVDALFANIQIFDSTGRLLLDFGHPGSSAGEFWLPAGIAIGSDNTIYVADSYNGRIQVFKYVGQP